ncbi:hypothetical protein F4679DRAFT_352306 [Xylaria curta]|nr:hypothetical protein F4679DRAFT_352306 [Xylaria curta]
MGHLSPNMMKSELLPFQKAIIAMSRAQYFKYLRASSAEGEPPQANKSIPNSKKSNREETKKDPTHHLANTPNPADKLSVGVCIFRLDGQTLSPAVLLLRRSPRWWRRRIFTSVGGRHGAGEWELPGGKVENDDFCISAAVERLVREKTGLRVTKIMYMLSDVRWREELKILLWEEEDETGKSTSGDSNEEEGDSGGDGDEEVEIKVDLEADVEWSSSIASEDSVNADDGKGNRTGEEALMSPLFQLDLEALGIRLPVDSSSPGSSTALRRLTMDSGSSSAVSAPPVPPKDPGRYAWGLYRGEHNDDDSEYHHADHERDNNKNHDPSSLKPAPLSLPSRKPPRRHRKTGMSSTALPARRDAQMIPYKMVRKEYVQLNFTVLVDEEPNNDEESLPEFRRRNGANGVDGRKGKGGIYEHDALEWATCARLQKLPMSEDLRSVVFEGLGWMGGLTGGFF